MLVQGLRVRADAGTHRRLAAEHSRGTAADHDRAAGAVGTLGLARPDVMPELPTSPSISKRCRAGSSGDARARSAQESIPVAHGGAAAAGVRRTSRRGAAPRRQAHRDRLEDDRWLLHPPDDRRPTALVRQGAHAARSAHRCCARVHERHADADRSRHEAARVAARVGSEAQLAEHDRGGLEVLDADRRRFASGSAHAITPSSARSPIRRSSAASATPTPTKSCIAPACRRSLQTRHLTTPSGSGCSTPRRRRWPTGSSACAPTRPAHFPEKVTAFRKDMAVHGRYGKPCPVCGTAVQRIATQKTRRTIARAARPAASCWPTARCRGCSRTTGRRRSRRWRTSESK